jgi:hypothetical protein
MNLFFLTHEFSPVDRGGADPAEGPSQRRRRVVAGGAGWAKMAKGLWACGRQRSKGPGLAVRPSGAGPNGRRAPRRKRLGQVPPDRGAEDLANGQGKLTF